MWLADVLVSMCAKRSNRFYFLAIPIAPQMVCLRGRGGGGGGAKLEGGGRDRRWIGGAAVLHRVERWDRPVTHEYSCVTALMLFE
eukprot:COSAG01_NODE_290_length_19382_cov_22.903801_7_plen_85_part_00